MSTNKEEYEVKHELTIILIPYVPTVGQLLLSQSNINYRL